MCTNVISHAVSIAVLFLCSLLQFASTYIVYITDVVVIVENALVL